MSGEILKALMQLFAIIAKQDAGLSGKEQQYIEDLLTRLLNKQSVDEYLSLFNKFVNKGSKNRLTSVGDSVRILGIAKKINKTLLSSALFKVDFIKRLNINSLYIFLFQFGC
jgi:hypothetical protein